MLGDRNKAVAHLANEILKMLRANYTYHELTTLLRSFSIKFPRYKVIQVTPSYTVTLTGTGETDVVFDFLRKIYVLMCEIDDETAKRMKSYILTYSEKTDIVLSMLSNEITSITKPYDEKEARECMVAAGEEFFAMHLFVSLCEAILAPISPDDPLFGRIRDLQIVDENISAILIETGKIRFEKKLGGNYWKTFNLLLNEILKYYEAKEGREGIKKFFDLIQHVLNANEKIAIQIKARENLLRGCLADRIKLEITGIERVIESGMMPRKGIIYIRVEKIGEGLAFGNAIAASYLAKFGSMGAVVSTISVEEYMDLSSLQFEAEDISKSIFVDWYTGRHKAVDTISQEGRLITVSSSLLSLEMGIKNALDSIQYSPLRVFLIELASSTINPESEEFTKFLENLKNLAYERDVLFVILSNRNAPKAFEAKLTNLADGVLDIYNTAEGTKIKAIHVKWEEPDYSEYLLTIEGRRIEIGVRKKKKPTKTLEEELGLEEEDPIEKYRRQLGRTYNYRIVENEYLLCLRIPRESVEELKDEDVVTISGRLKRENLDKLKEKILSVYFICDNNYVETDIHRFMDAITMRRASPIHRAAEEIKSLRIGERDPVIRKLLDDLSRTGARLGARLRRGSKAAEVTTTGGRGRVVGYKQAGENPQDIALLPTIRVAAAKGRRGNSRFVVEIRKEDFQEKIRKTRTPVYLCFVVDTSGYEEPEIRGKIVSSLVISMLKDAYERRDQVALVTFSGNHATVQCNFTTDVEYVGSYMKNVEFGGLTPLGSGLMTGLNVLHAKVGDRVGVVPILILLTTGTANVPVTPGGNIRRELLGICRLIWNSGYKVLVVDISERGSNLAREIALLTGGRYYHPQNLRYQKVVLTRNLLDALRTKDLKTAIEASKKFLKER
ncbi:MAG: VWA domain-containing protein [Thermoplasmata archaeon]|nr:VWA domain-containing protein [Thermoplasmata archaeon]